MRVLLTGGTGFIGRQLVRSLTERGDECVVISRRSGNPWSDDRVKIVQADPTQRGAWQAQLGDADAVVNLAGERIVDPPHRWTADRKRRLVDSRVAVTQNLVQGMGDTGRAPGVLVSASAVGYYGPRGDEVIDESSGPGHDFLATLCVAWEHAARAAERTTTVSVIRTGIVLSPDGGALSALLPLFKSGLGGPWGHGRQWWSWIHLRDAVQLIVFALDRRLTGPVNLTAPNPVTVNEFASALGRTLNRPAIVRAPEFAMRLALGESAAALLDLQRVVPTRALDEGYRFAFPTLPEVLQDLFGRT